MVVLDIGRISVSTRTQLAKIVVGKVIPQPYVSRRRKRNILHVVFTLTC